MARKSGLGRGLDALIPQGEENLVSGAVTEVPIDHIEPNPRQPRTRPVEEALVELAESIREHGVIQPVILSPGRKSNAYYLVAGERRWKAAKLAGLTTVPAIIREVTEQQRLLWALIENIQRADLNPMEAAEAYRQLGEDFGLTHEEIAQRVGKNRATVSNTLRLLGLPLVAKAAITKGVITEGHARALLSLQSEDAQIALLQIILTENLSVRQAEALAQKYKGEKPPPKEPKAVAPELVALEEQLQDALGTRVRLSRNRKGGSITIHFYSDEELNALMDRLLGS
jgi:ParB family transcriptional regulator, chromosome partitioning protein